jgi:thioredoxin reductase (NADPH)
MTEDASNSSVFDSRDGGARYPVFDVGALEELGQFGSERAVASGDVLYEPGEATLDFFVVLAGQVEIVEPDPPGERVVVTFGPGQFVGELGLLTGQRTFLKARAAEEGRVLVVTNDEFRRLMATRPTISDVIFTALIARREALRGNPAINPIRIIGSRYSAEALALRSFASRNRLVYSWIDIEGADDVGELLAAMGLTAGDTPVVATANDVLSRATPGEFAELLGLTYRPIPGRTFDLVVVGAGPAGLAASVYGASEGLDVVLLDAVSPGGQAGSSSRIENYAGFPNGISGGDLTARTAIQAQRLGASLVSPCEASALRVDDGFKVLTLADGSEIPTRAIVLATGARYQRLAVPELAVYEGCGVYYAATDLEARMCGGADVVVVGGGNSAGQAAIYLSQQGCRVAIVIRAADLSASMSHYLIDRIAADPHIDVVASTEVSSMFGEGRLEGVTLARHVSATTETMPCAALFCFIGAEPATAWLPEALSVDERGFVLTDRSLPATALTDPAYDARPPLPFETSVPGVFAVGDVRFGSMKRVAAAVGEGSSAVRAVHEFLSLPA